MAHRYSLILAVCYLQKFCATQIKTFDKAVVVKVAWFRQKNIFNNQWNRIGGPELDPHKCDQLIFDKDTKAIHWSKYSLFSNLCWDNRKILCKKISL